jgi:succinate dehydrogenase/fumarate reductase flavoprotein subunit
MSEHAGGLSVRADQRYDVVVIGGGAACLSGAFALAGGCW